MLHELLRFAVPYILVLSAYVGLGLFFLAMFWFGSWMDYRAERREDARLWDEECRKSREARLARESRL